MVGGFTPCLTRQKMVEVSTRRGSDVSLLAQHLDGRLALADSLKTYAWVRLSAIRSAYEALRDLYMFAIFSLHLLSAGGSHSSAIADLLRLIEILEELHTEVQGIISSPHLVTTLLYDVSQQCNLYLNRCVAVLALEALEAPGATVPFTLDPILLEMEGKHYISPLPTWHLTDLLAG